jgi:hypothetical protein
MRFRSLLSILLLGFVVFSGNAFGQAIGSITGVVSDVSQARIPGVGVTAINTATGVRTSTISNDTGAGTQVLLSPLPAGGALTGFRTACRQHRSAATSIALQPDDGDRMWHLRPVTTIASPGCPSSSVGRALSQDQVSALPLTSGDARPVNTLRLPFRRRNHGQ